MPSSLPIDSPQWAMSIQLAQQGGAGQGGAMMQLLQLLGMAGPGFTQAPYAAAMGSQAMMAPMVGAMIGGPTSPFAGPAVSQMFGRGMMQAAAGGAFTDVRGIGGGGAGGFGLGAGGSLAMANMMEGMTGAGPGQGLTMRDLADVTQMAGQGGFFRGVGDVRQARQRLTQLVDTVTELHKELSMTVQDVTQRLSQTRTMGFAGAGEAAAAFRGMTQTGAITGMGIEQVMGFSAGVGQQLRSAIHTPLGMSTLTGQRGLEAVGGASRLGIISDEMLMNATGMGGAQGVQALTQRMIAQSANQLNRSPMTHMMAAMMDPTTGQIDQSRVQQMMSGNIGPGTIMSQANQYVSSLGPDGYAKWLGQMPEMRGQFMAATGGMGGLAFAGMGMREHGFDRDPGNYRNIAAFSKITGLDQMESRAAMEMMSNWGTMQEQNQITRRQQHREQRVAERIVEGATQHNLEASLNNLIGEHTRRSSSLVTSAVEGITDAMNSVFQSSTGGYEVTLGPGLIGQMSGYRGSAGEQSFSSSQYADLGAHSGNVQELETQAQLAAARGDLAGAERLRSQAKQARENLGRIAGESPFASQAYWGSDVGIGESGESIARRRGLDASSAKARTYRETSGARETVTQQLGVALAGENADALKSALADLYGVSVEDIEKKSLADIQAASGSKEKAQQAMFLMQAMGGGALGGQNALGLMALGEEFYRSGVATKAFRGETGASLGEMDVVSGAQGRVAPGQASVAYREAARRGRGLVGNEWRAAANTIQSNPELAGKLLETLAGQEGQVSFHEMLKKSGASDEEIAAAGKDFTGSATEISGFVSATMDVAKAAMAEQIGSVGMLSRSARDAYDEAARKPGEYSDRVMRFVDQMRSATRHFHDQQEYAEGIQITRGALSSLMEGGSLNERDKAALQGMGVNVQRIDKAMRFRKSGEGYDVEELSQLGALGSVTKGLDVSPEELSKIIGKQSVQHQIQEIVKDQLVLPGVGAEGPGQGSPAVSFAKELATELRDGGPLRVVIDGGLAGLLGVGGNSSEPTEDGTGAPS